VSPVEILKAARELIAKPERWTRGVIARAGTVPLTSAMGEGATCWCAMGAVDKCAGGPDCSAPALDLLYPIIPGCGIAQFNDSHDHPEVLALFDRAIAKAGAQ
jgi:hypothetical protein